MAELEAEYVRGPEKYYTFYTDNRKIITDVKNSQALPALPSLNGTFGGKFRKWRRYDNRNWTVFSRQQ